MIFPSVIPVEYILDYKQPSSTAYPASRNRGIDLPRIPLDRVDLGLSNDSSFKSTSRFLAVLLPLGNLVEIWSHQKVLHPTVHSNALDTLVANNYFLSRSDQKMNTLCCGKVGMQQDVRN